VPRFKNKWSYNSTPQYAFMVWCSVKEKHRDNFTFAFTERNAGLQAMVKPLTLSGHIVYVINMHLYLEI